MRVLITGGAGFIGSHLCQELLGRGVEVICMDDFSTGKRQGIVNLLSDPAFQVIEQDITKLDPNKQLSQFAGVKQIYNLACPASPVKYQLDPIKTLKTNVIGAINVLELAYNLKARILQASTSEVYGNPTVHPQSEDYNGSVNPIGVRAAYDEGKRCAETLFFDYQRQLGVDIKVVRIFNTYGPCLDPDDGRVISNFFVQALQNKDLTVYGQGEQTRSFCYIDDLLAGLLTMMAVNNFCGPVNLGNPQEYTVLEIAKKIIEITNSQSSISYRNLPEDDPERRCPDISKAREKLNWQPRISLEEGLIRTRKYFELILQSARGR